MHEAGHAAHRSADDKFFERTPEQKEYVAYMLEFPENPYIALKEFLKHPDTMDRSTDHIMWLMGWGDNKDYKEAPEKINKFVFLSTFFSSVLFFNKSLRFILALGAKRSVKYESFLSLSFTTPSLAPLFISEITSQILNLIHVLRVHIGSF